MSKCCSMLKFVKSTISVVYLGDLNDSIININENLSTIKDSQDSTNLDVDSMNDTVGNVIADIVDLELSISNLKKIIF